MPTTISSQYMSLPVPVVSVDPGTAWATDLNSCLTLIDQHDHSSGKGPQITPSGLNINSDLTFGSNNAIAIRSARFTAQSSPIGSASDLDCVYVSGVDLYYNDGNGNQIRMTASGSVAGTSGSIGGLVSPASVTYSSGAYIFKSTATIPGNLDAGSVVIREVVASGKGITLSAPAALASNYSLTLPGALPAGTSFLQVDSSGNIAASIATANGITRGNLAAVGQQVSSSCGSVSRVTASYADVPNLTVTITTTGRPVVLLIQGDGASNNGNGFLMFGSSTTGLFRITRDGSTITGDVAVRSQTSIPGIAFLDVPSAGSHTYVVQYQGNGSNALSANYVVLAAYEL